MYLVVSFTAPSTSENISCNDPTQYLFHGVKRQRSQMPRVSLGYHELLYHDVTLNMALRSGQNIPLFFRTCPNWPLDSRRNMCFKSAPIFSKPTGHCFSSLSNFELTLPGCPRRRCQNAVNIFHNSRLSVRQPATSQTSKFSLNVGRQH